MEREIESIVYVVTVEASCPAGACRSAGRAENKFMSQAQLSFSGLSSVKNISCLPQGSWQLSSAGVFSWAYVHTAPSPYPNEPELLSSSPVDMKRLSDICFNFSHCPTPTRLGI